MTAYGGPTALRSASDDGLMKLEHEKTNKRDDYHYFISDHIVTVQIGKSTNKGKYIWSIFHPDIKCAIWGDESDSLELAKKDATEWIINWVNTKGKTDSGPIYNHLSGENDCPELVVSQDKMAEWAENCLRINHLNTLVPREIKQGNVQRAANLSERARKRSWNMFNQMIDAGAKKPPRYREPDPE